MWISVLTPTAACCSSPSAVTSTGRGELVNTSLARSIVHDVGVLGDRPERPVVRHVDPRHRGVGAQMGQRRMQFRLVGVRLRVGEHLGGFVHDRGYSSATPHLRRSSCSTAVTVASSTDGGKAHHDAVDHAVAALADLARPARRSGRRRRTRRGSRRRSANPSRPNRPAATAGAARSAGRPSRAVREPCGRRASTRRRRSACGCRPRRRASSASSLPGHHEQRTGHLEVAALAAGPRPCRAAAPASSPLRSSAWS